MRDPMIKQFGKIYRTKIKNGWSLIYAPKQKSFVMQVGTMQCGYTYHYFSQDEFLKMINKALEMSTKPIEGVL